jgi:Potential Queuosine, Q, salvage protein family
MLYRANHSAVRLINLLVNTIPSFNDAAKPLPSISSQLPLKFYKRAQILIADLWACFCNTSYGYFTDIDKLSMFADYRVPQILHSLGCLRYSPHLTALLDSNTALEQGGRLEIEIRGCSIWCVELLRKEIRIEWGRQVNAILVDFWLWDEAQKLKMEGGQGFNVSFHRTRGIFY